MTKEELIAKARKNSILLYGPEEFDGFEFEPAPKPTAAALDRAYTSALAVFGGDPGSLGRLNRALAIAKSGGVRDLGGGSYEVNGQSGRFYLVNGACQCADYCEGGAAWCKHRLAAALWRKALQNGAGSAANTPAPVAPTTGTEPQPDYITDHAEWQAWADRLDDRQMYAELAQGLG